MVLVGYLIAFLAAFWVYNDAKRRGHDLGSALLWAVGTLAMAMIVLPLYLLFGRRQQMSKVRKDSDIIDVEATVVSDNVVNCNMCGSKVKEDYNVCPYCGYTLRPKCQTCGQELNRDLKTCPYCQTPAAPK